MFFLSFFKSMEVNLAILDVELLILGCIFVIPLSFLKSMDVNLAILDVELSIIGCIFAGVNCKFVSNCCYFAKYTSQQIILSKIHPL